MEQHATIGSTGQPEPTAGSPSAVDLSRRALGQFGERQAARYLEGLGYHIVERNWRHRHGELDLVALDADCLVFVEVKTRSSVAFGRPAEAVDRTKMARLRRLAGLYLQAHPTKVGALRIDVVAITTGGGQRQLEHYKGVDL